MSRPELSRRHFLRAAGTLIALPALTSMGFKAFAAAKAVTHPKRMVFLGFGYGVTNETWFPKLTDAGANYALPEGSRRWPSTRRISPSCRASRTSSATKHTGAARSG